MNDNSGRKNERFHDVTHTVNGPPMKRKFAARRVLIFAFDEMETNVHSFETAQEFFAP